MRKHPKKNRLNDMVKPLAGWGVVPVSVSATSVRRWKPG